MSKAIQCDRCGKTKSVGMSETFDGLPVRYGVPCVAARVASGA